MAAPSARGRCVWRGRRSRGQVLGRHWCASGPDQVLPPASPHARPPVFSAMGCRQFPGPAPTLCRLCSFPSGSGKGRFFTSDPGASLLPSSPNSGPPVFFRLLLSCPVPGTAPQHVRNFSSWHSMLPFVSALILRCVTYPSTLECEAASKRALRSPHFPPFHLPACLECLPSHFLPV